MAREYFVYLITNVNNNVLYIGVTSNLEQRIYEHKNKIIKGFSSKYNTSKLVYFEQFSDPENAIAREKQLKKWNRSKKDFLVNKMNSKWKDLSLEWYENKDLSTTLEMTDSDSI